MGNDDEAKSVKTEKTSSPLTPNPKTQTNQTNIHVYPDWAAMQSQAYYGHRVPMPAYYNSPAASGHAPPPYMWGPPQATMPPYGAPYAAIYSHGGVYGHPGVPLGSNGQGVPLSPAAANPSSVDSPSKSSGNIDRGSMKKSKGFDALEMSIGNNNTDNVESEADQSLSKSSASEGSSSDENTSRANQSRRKRNREETSAIDKKPEMQASRASVKDVNTASTKVLGTTVTAVGIPAKLVGPAVSPGITTVLELKKSSSLTSIPQPSAVLSPEIWSQNDRELKRERRKQSNRESARRSRLRKQVETDELARKVEALNADNESLKSEINRLAESSDRLRVENSSLMEKLKKARVGRMEEIVMNIDDKRAGALSTENLLSRVDNSGALARDIEEEASMYEKKAAGAKLHQLLDASPRTDAIAAS